MHRKHICIACSQTNKQKNTPSLYSIAEAPSLTRFWGTLLCALPLFTFVIHMSHLVVCLRFKWSGVPAVKNYFIDYRLSLFILLGRAGHATRRNITLCLLSAPYNDRHHIIQRRSTSSSLTVQFPLRSRSITKLPTTSRILFIAEFIPCLSYDTSSGRQLGRNERYWFWGHAIRRNVALPTQCSLHPRQSSIVVIGYILCVSGHAENKDADPAKYNLLSWVPSTFRILFSFIATATCTTCWTVAAFTVNATHIWVDICRVCKCKSHHRQKSRLEWGQSREDDKSHHRPGLPIQNKNEWLRVFKKSVNWATVVCTRLNRCDASPSTGRSMARQLQRGKCFIQRIGSNQTRSCAVWPSGNKVGLLL